MAAGSSYNSGIPKIILNSVSRAHGLVPWLRRVAPVLVLVLSTVLANATDWSVPEQQLARKILAATAARQISLSFENRSSLGRRDSDIIQNGMRSAIETLGMRLVPSAQATANITVSLSENVSSYVWVAQITPAEGGGSVVMVSVPRSAGSSQAHDSVPLTLRKFPVWEQNDPILDLAVLEESAVPGRVAVLGAGRLSLYRMQGGRWQQEQALEIAHTNPWPRDLRGRLIPASDHLLDIYLPGVFCQTAGNPTLTLTCREGSEPWPLVSRPSTPPVAVRAEFALGQNFFTGVVSPAVGNSFSLGAFYSAAPVPSEGSVFWVLTGVDRQVHIVDGGRDRAIQANWGSDIATVRTSCGAGSQVLATSSGDGPDTVRAYEFPERDPVSVSGAIEFPGAISALWTEAKGDTAIAVARNQESGSYEAFRLAVACSQ